MKSLDSSQFHHTEASQHMPHITHQSTHMHMGPKHMWWTESTERAAWCVRRDLYGEIKDPTKMTHAKTAPVERALGAKRSHANHSQQGGRRCSHGYGACDTSEGIRGKGSKRQAYHLVTSVAEVIVGLCKRESTQPRPGVAPGDPQSVRG